MNRYDAASDTEAMGSACLTLGDILAAAQDVSERDAAALVARFLAVRRVYFVHPDAQRALDLLARELHPQERMHVA